MCWGIGSRALDKPGTVILDRLGECIHRRLEEALAAGVGEGRGAGLSGALTHAAALLRMDGEQRLRGLGDYLFWEGIDRLESLGRLDLYGLALDAGAGWLALVSAEKAGDPKWQIYQNILLTRRGNLLASQGDLAGALEAYRAGMAIGQRLAAADPSNAGWQRDLSVSLTKITQFHETQGQHAEALRFAEQSLAIGEGLALLDTSNVIWRNDVKFSRRMVARLQNIQE